MFLHAAFLCLMFKKNGRLFRAGHLYSVGVQAYMMISPPIEPWSPQPPIVKPSKVI